MSRFAMIFVAAALVGAVTVILVVLVFYYRPTIEFAYADTAPFEVWAAVLGLAAVVCLVVWLKRQRKTIR